MKYIKFIVWPILIIISMNVESLVQNFHLDKLLLEFISAEYYDIIFLIVSSIWFSIFLSLCFGFAIGRSYGFLKALLFGSGAKLVIRFDEDIQNATPIEQKNVMYHYWMHIPSLYVNFENKSINPSVGHYLLFVVLRWPTFVNYNQIKVNEGGVMVEILASANVAALLRMNGDMRGKTLSLEFSRSPIVTP